MKQFTIIIDSDGSSTSVLDPELHGWNRAIGYVKKTRASYILPKNKTKRLAFILLRRMFGDEGRIADWTRTWKGPWQVSWAEDKSKVVFTHKRRSQCLYWEKKELEQRLAR